MQVDVKVGTCKYCLDGGTLCHCECLDTSRSPLEDGSGLGIVGVIGSLSIRVRVKAH